MLSKGEWRTDKEGSRKRIGFHLNAIHTPWGTLRDVAAEHLKCKDTTETQLNFINSGLAEPFEQVSSIADADTNLAWQGRYTEGVAPTKTGIITGGVGKTQVCSH